MAGILSSFVLAGLLTASPADVFSFDGPRVTARTVGSVGFFTQGSVPFTDLFERGSGSAELFTQDRIADPRATYGDVARLEATFQIGGDSYRVELAQGGFPPAQAMAGTPVTGPLPSPPAQPISGGVVVGQDLHGTSGLGFSNMTRVQSATAVWGVGRVWRNGALLSDTALIHAAALSQGAHADDDTFRLMPSARPGDTELYVMVWNLPRALEPRGFIQFGFDDVAIDINGTPVPAVAFVPTAGVFVGVAPPSTPVPGGASLGLVPNSGLSQQQQQQGVGGSGLATTGQTGTGQTGTGQTGTGGFSGTPFGQELGGTDGLANPLATQTAETADVTLPGPQRAVAGDVLNPFLDTGRVSLSTQNPGDPDIGTPGFQTTPIVPEAFLTPDTPGRVAISAGQPAEPGQQDSQFPGQQTPFIPEGFQNDARVRSASQLPPATVGGFVPLTPGPQQQSTFLSSSGSFSVVPLVPGVSGPEFAFGGPRVTTGVVRTPEPQQVVTPAVPLIATPLPLNAQQPVPLVTSPQPLNGQSAVPLVSTPTPLNSQPISATPPGATTSPVTSTPAATAVPGLVPGATSGTGGAGGGATGSVSGPGPAPTTTAPGAAAPGGGAAPAP
ncbi:hypothetical protein [Archangium sp.]|jgi:hypothetical protein|uniref:hypothetical protein n=1 Tax=Archangium sp. TaxID=1872627 RepID=UPI002EDB55B7